MRPGRSPLFAVQCGGVALNLSPRNRERLNQILKTTQRPLNLSEAESFAALGDFVVQYLKYDQKLPARTLVACARTLRLIDTDVARECLKGYGDDQRPTVVSELRQVLDPLQLRVVQQTLLPIVECDCAVKERLQDAPREKVFDVLSGTARAEPAWDARCRPGAPERTTRVAADIGDGRGAAAHRSAGPMGVGRASARSYPLHQLRRHGAGTDSGGRVPDGRAAI
jgi:hypothetical protein